MRLTTIAMILLVSAALAITVTITEEQLQERMESRIEDTNFTAINVDLNPGTIRMEATRVRDNGISDELSLEIELSVEDSRLEAEVVSADLNGTQLPQARRNLWNERIEAALDFWTAGTQGRLQAAEIDAGRITLTFEE